MSCFVEYAGVDCCLVFCCIDCFVCCVLISISVVFGFLYFFISVMSSAITYISVHSIPSGVSAVFIGDIHFDL